MPFWYDGIEHLHIYGNFGSSLSTENGKNGKNGKNDPCCLVKHLNLGSNLLKSPMLVGLVKCNPRVCWLRPPPIARWYWRLIGGNIINLMTKKVTVGGLGDPWFWGGCQAKTRRKLSELLYRWKIWHWSIESSRLNNGCLWDKNPDWCSHPTTPHKNLG